MTLPLRPFSRGAVPVPTGSESADFDRAAIDGRGVPEAALMESAGRASADLAGRLAPDGPVVVLAGSGNNGGDAVVLARTLRARGRSVTLVVVGDRRSPDPLLHGWEVPTVPVAELGAEGLARALAGASLVVDGLLGTGIRGAPREPAARVIEAVAGTPAPILALDVPSGVDADTGAVPGAAVAADVTVGFGWPKLGVLLEPGRSRAGRVVAAEIGFPPLDPGTFGARLLTPAWLSEVRPRRAAVTHKNRVGAVLVVGGSTGMAGAVVLAARAALRSGAGFVRVASTATNRAVLQAALPDAPFVSLDDVAGVDAALEASRAVVVGCGLGTDDAAASALERVLASPSPVVVDADALNLIAEGRPRPPTGLGRAGPRLLTPHPGEMGRLLGLEVAAVEADRPGCARRLAAQTETTVVLKGTPTLVAESDGSLGVSALASSDLAVAGMGDVLAGSIGAFLAQRLAPADAAGAALLVGARAAERTGLGPGLTASDVPASIPAALDDAGPGETELPFAWVTLDLDAPR